MNNKKTIQDLKNKTGKLLFFGGVYSNLQSLQALKKIANDAGYLPENIFCTGDIVGYCAQPNECIGLIKDWGIHSIAGNVELQLREDADDCGCDFSTGGTCDLLSKNWYSFAKNTITEESRSWLNTLPEHIRFTWHGKKIMLVHGSWFNTSDFIFKSTRWEIKNENFEAMDSDIIVAGHCGLPFADKKENKLWLNAGVTGMPANDGNNCVWYATLDVKDQEPVFKFHHYTYDFLTASDLMVEKGLPASYAQTLITGIWDNCEILPEVETAQQGKALIF
jgi:predicted phosphodiesterase